MTAVPIGATALLAVVFGTSVITRTRSSATRRAFVASLRQWRVLPEPLVVPVAFVVTAAECVVVLCLMFTTATSAMGRSGVVGTIALTGSVVLLTGFTGGMALSMRRGTGGSCRCFGDEERPLRLRHLIRNGVLIVVALAGLVGTSGMSSGDGLLAAGVGALGGLVAVHLDNLVDLFVTSPTVGRSSSEN
ncbi:MauE/DoxX family redox-associated membrane protein [Amycolatopsis sp. QT-25]|uniref:MauE/DoxX family redox-associated membrane protein n=1 Tax=Amycolatopsis sp. QT-25 TaxID=3034022 RepID=UPI0023ED6D65|nr:MauE/DoxX family redox-associated membrane protein [Amycolatopsis sp. QT-25]WET76527.1 MauE/DoxX family redox-associated membrane protein [Amycolatopsis sp. QT-25]